jgi:hypothetical protein
VKKFLFSRRNLSVGALLAAFVALPAPAAWADTSASSCPNLQLTQPFLSYGDSNWYTLTPGESADSFDGGGWVLNGGAGVVTTTLADGQTGSVLDLPPGSSATSPITCVQSGMPLARMITQIVGGPKSNSTAFQVWNANGTRLGGAMGVLGRTSWQLSPPVNIVPGSFAGTKQVYFTFTSNQNQGDLRLYDFNIDPHMRD